ncbi:Crp/FNR family transcriptional regulator [Pseudopedobacter saltans DSM 12145]|uniref:Crp/FNR family transcriptional regulator n=1 Tax=Pseudopedobacter saltans (strain ATCC 51119 / DSM 12145 / JCM 21818 / CCUG 39354 / LMG 10337 / NBRC 100064 / NCIMB 13643) TaxID=762903 RepID=F0SBH5_PSESL|nr:ThuA domain-containing protein [Pseudopedobacter saltans]ADY51621.1 Crp/FNR family transcriptional regulator [Pseudopedobacter saltans DSM 12145]
MKKKSILILSFLTLLCVSGFALQRKPKNLLVFSYTQKYRHKSIEPGKESLTKWAKQKGYQIDFSENPNDFSDDNLKKYNALIFLNPTGTNVFTDSQKSAFKKYINKGGGFVGIHAATDFCFEWEWYGKLVGAFFTNHPKIQEATIKVIDNKHQSTSFLDKEFRYTDEWYNFKDLNPEVKVLLALDESSYTGGTMNGNHPIAWYHKFDGGKSFYTGLGHRDECFSDPLFMKHLEGGIEYVLK